MNATDKTPLDSAALAAAADELPHRMTQEQRRDFAAEIIRTYLEFERANSATPPPAIKRWYVCGSIHNTTGFDRIVMANTEREAEIKARAWCDQTYVGMDEFNIESVTPADDESENYQGVIE